MKQTKFFLFFVLFSFCVSAQNRPGVDYFPQIGFFDFIVNYKSPPNNLSTAAEIEDTTKKYGYYFDKLTELGLTNFVSDGQEHTSNLTVSSPFRINDMGFSWKADPPYNFNPSIYMNAMGHDKDNYALEFGGTPVGNIDPVSANYGFVDPGEDNANYWSMAPADLPEQVSGTGFDDYEEIGDATIYYRGVRTGNDDLGAIVWGKLSPVQFPFSNLNHLMKIRIRKLNTGGDNEEAIRIIISSTPINQANINRFYSNVYKNAFIPDANLAELGLDQTVLGSEIQWVNDYGWFESDLFTLEKNKQLYFAILWSGNIDLNIDKIAIMTEKYDEVFENGSVATETFMNGIKADILSVYGSNPGSTIQDFYFDEPYLLTARYKSRLQEKIKEAYSGINTMHLNGATGGVPEYFHRFDHEYARADLNQPVGNYILFNMYPFGETNDFDQTTVQTKLNHLIRCSSFGPAHEQYEYNYAGLRTALKAANQYDTYQTNDVPLFMTLQIHAEHQVDPSTHEYVPNARGTRPPSRDEIFAMGHVSLAHGVKGFMYYMVPTRSEVWGDGTHWGTYGLFDQLNNHYNYSTKNGMWQDPGSKQIPNSRYTAVKDFIASMKPYENTLLRLKWLEAKYWNETVASPYPWINSVQTSINANFTNPDNEEMVQTGYFEEYSHLTGYNQNAKYIYIVNRRCNLQEADYSHRYIRFTIDSTVASNYTNVKVTNMKTGQTFFTSKNSLFTLFLNAGDGTLLKFEPTILAGGLLVDNETVSSSIEVDSSLELSQYKKLRIENGADVTFKNSSRLYVYNSDLEIEGTPTDPSVINFVSRNWTLGNGLVARYADVSINNARIKNASAGIYGYRCSTFVVSNTIIDSCYFGISMEEQGSPYGTNVLENITLNKCIPRGITTNDVILMAEDVVISGGENAMMFWDSEFNCFLMQEIANINILSHTTGVYSNNSELNFGYDDGSGIPDGAYNTFLSADNFYVENYSQVMAQYDYWESKSNYCDLTSTLVDEPSFEYEGDNPLIIPNDELASVKHNFTGEGGSTAEKFQLAKRMYKKGHLIQARNICSDIIDNNSNDELIPAVISLLIRTFKEEGKEALGQYIANGNNATSNSTAKGLLQAATALFTEDVNTVYDDIITRYPGKYPAEYSLYKKALYQTGSQMDKKGAKITFNKLRTDFPNSLFIKDLAVRLADTMGFSNKSVTPLGLPKQQSQTSNVEVFEYQLLNNYPNPFNPETVIKFSLKERSNVTLDVYNIAGQKVAELVNGEMEKGFFERKFDGTKLSSGVYIFRLSAQSLENGNLKYSKTMKSLLLK